MGAHHNTTGWVRRYTCTFRALHAGLRQQPRTSTTYVGMLQTPSPTAAPRPHLHCQDRAIDSHAKVKPQAYRVQRPTPASPPTPLGLTGMACSRGVPCQRACMQHARGSTQLPTLNSCSPHCLRRACMRAPTHLLLARCAACCAACPSAAGGLVGCHAAPLPGPHRGATCTAGHGLAGHPAGAGAGAGTRAAAHSRGCSRSRRQVSHDSLLPQQTALHAATSLDPCHVHRQTACAAVLPLCCNCHPGGAGGMQAQQAQPCQTLSLL
jgi:hypothetical protein